MYRSLYGIIGLALISTTVIVYAENEKEHNGMYPIGDISELTRKLAEIQKRGGARAFGPRLNSEGPFYSEAKRYNNVAPSYYLYRQPKRGGGRAFAAYYKPAKFNDPRYDANLFFKKREIPDDVYTDYIY